MQWETVIGLEIHTQLATQSKIFSGSSTAFGAEPNTQASLIDLGMPGVLPVLNKEAVRMAVRFGKAIGAQVAERSVFARKNYFYPDLPKGYQISQYELPVVGKGEVEIVLEDGSTKRVGVTRAHLEEDAGKSLHEDFHGMTGIDLNRAGTPLLEIVSEPDMRSAKEAVAYAKKIHQIVTYIGICDGNMQEGSFRMDANVSVRPKGQAEFGTRAELKNINSFRFLEKAINFEVERQIELIEDGGRVVQETRLYDADKDETRSMRSKEEANDYRYFPDPDLLPLEIDAGLHRRGGGGDARAAGCQSRALRVRLRSVGLRCRCADRQPRAGRLLRDRGGGRRRRQAGRQLGDGRTGRGIEQGGRWRSATVRSMPRLSVSWSRGSGTTPSRARSPRRCLPPCGPVRAVPMQVIEAKGLRQITDTGAIEALVDEVIAANAAQVENYRSADPVKQPKMLGFFVGQIMKKSQGKANPQQVNELLRKKLG